METRVYLKDTDANFRKLSYNEAHAALVAAGQWAEANCTSYVTYGVVDVSDVSSAACDWMGEYTFSDEKDATWFKLKWA
jgi:hypothetical protein